MTDTTRERLSSLIREAVIRLKSSETMDAVADHLIAHGVTLPEPPAPAAPPKPTWEPILAACDMLGHWSWQTQPVTPFLRRLYAQLHRDRVAALPSSGGDINWAVIHPRKGYQWQVDRRNLLALADDGNGD